MRFVFLSEGRMFLKDGDAAPVEIESQFAKEAVERIEAHNARRAWRTDGGQPGSHFTPETIWGRQAELASDQRPVVRHVARGAQADEIYYVLAMSASSGLFVYHLVTREERRLFHRHDFVSRGISCDAASGQVVISALDREELGKLELLDEPNRQRARITAGDSDDAQPAHDPRQRKVVWFQSSGAGRNEKGEVVALGPAAIMRLDHENGALETVLEDENCDFLAPKVDRDGWIYFIRRPYGHRGVGVVGQLKAFLLIPYHLFGAIFGFLDVFSRFFGKRPLKPATVGPDAREQGPRRVTFQGASVDLEGLLKRQGKPTDDLQLVPKSWALIRYHPDHGDEVVAHHVVAFDVTPAGEVVYSDGLRVWLHGSPRRKLHAQQIVQNLAVV